MAEIAKIDYSTKELLVLLLKDQNIHEGHWVLTATFLQSAINIGQSSDGSDIAPACLSIINRIGLEHVKEPLPFSVDAAVVNPKEFISARKREAKKLAST